MLPAQHSFIQGSSASKTLTPVLFVQPWVPTDVPSPPGRNAPEGTCSSAQPRLSSACTSSVGTHGFNIQMWGLETPRTEHQLFLAHCFCLQICPPTLLASPTLSPPSLFYCHPSPGTDRSRVRRARPATRLCRRWELPKSGVKAVGRASPDSPARPHTASSASPS